MERLFSLAPAGVSSSRLDQPSVGAPALAGQGFALVLGIDAVGPGDVLPSAEERQQRIVAELVVVVQVFVAQGQAHHPLEEEFLHSEFELLFIPMIGEAVGELADDAEPLFDLAEQQSAGVGGDHAAIEIGDDFSASVGLKQERLWVTVCHDETVVGACRELCDNST